MTNQEVCVISYNSRGFSKMHQDFIKSLSSDQIIGNKLSIICNQENFILRGNYYKILQTMSGFHVFINPAVKNTLDRGRPKGGMFIAVPDCMKNQVSDVSPGHWRVQAVTISSAESKTLLINTYFPCDSGRQAGGNIEEAIELIQVIKKIVDENKCQSLIWCGDINTDFRRISGQVDLVSQAVEELQLQKLWDKYTVDFTRVCYQNENIITSSIIDHFFCSLGLSLAVTDAGVIHSPDNRSDHSPVYCVLSNLLIKTDTSEQAKQEPRPSWKASTDEEKDLYRSLLDEKLSGIFIPLPLVSCEDVKCSNPDHCDMVDKLAIDVLEAVQTSAESSLKYPKSSSESKRKTNLLPGWKETVKPFRDTDYFWHQVWISCKKPLNTVVHSIMKRTKNIYHYQFNKCKRAEERIRKNKLLEACLNQGEGGGDIFKEIKALRHSKQVVATSIDGKNEDIPGHFQTIYSQLYNSVNDAEDLARVSSEVDSKVNSFSLREVGKVTPELVKSAAKKLKPGKSDPVYTFSSDCIKVDSDLLAELLSIIIRSYLIHGHVTRFLLLATLVPIIKDKLGCINSSKNYRSIAISSLLLKLLDWIIILLFGDKLGLHDLQFAYQPGISGNMCTFAVLETVDYFLRNGSEVFLCTMDMTKAFDMTKHSLLFSKILQAGLSAIFVRLLIFVYVEQFANVRWNGQVSTFFSMHNGVRQGAILSAIAYCFYCQELFTLLERNRSGCWINGNYMGLLGYSDDNVCLAPSLKALQDMLKICEDFAESHNLKFSTNADPIKCKTKTMAFLKRPRPLPNLTLCGNPLPWTNRIKHLGINIENKIDGCEHDMVTKNAQYVAKNIELNQEFSFAHPNTKMKINQIYNSHYSGSPLWNLFGRGSLSIESSYNRSVKVMFDLPYATHRSLIEPLTESPHVKLILIKRFLGFLDKIRKSPKKALNMLLCEAMKDARSVTGRNLRNIMLLVGKSKVEDVCFQDHAKLSYFTLDRENMWRIPMIQKLSTSSKVTWKRKALTLMN